ncbi:MAG: DNA polymerase III subunit gamma/tau [Gammaproteobacteria bacterium]|nr:DNA polymerase III subunit gamma/tau [Gammaproteobacteria bacterium]MDH5593492.1 DNA polymerase III subunit gamma/tau [Gammaproteobacteria bacterium]
MSYQVLARKWRPGTFHEVAGQEHVLRALINALDNDRLHHAFLFTGTRGVGKTTIARILAKSLNCENGVSATPCGECSACNEINEGRFVDLIEVDAASRTKVEDTRELLENVQYAPTRGRYKIYLIDEVHMLSTHSFNALLKTLEEPPPHVKFLLATTDPQKLPVTILSRCLQFNLKRLPQSLITEYLINILEKENIEHEVPAIKLLARAADGSMRDALSLMDQAIAYGAGKLGKQDVQSMLGTIEQTYISEIIEALAANSGQALLETIHTLAESVPDFSNVLEELLSVLHQMALAQVVPDAVDEEQSNREEIIRLSQVLSQEDVQLFYQIGINGRRDMNFAPDPRSGLEMVLLRMLAFRPSEARAVASVKTAVSNSAVSSAKKTVTPAQSENIIKAEEISSLAEPIQDDDWSSIIAGMKLTGVLKEAAANCAIKEKDENNIILVLAPEHAALLNAEREKKLEKALQKFTGSRIRLKVEIESMQIETPAARQKRLQSEKHQAAVNKIESDSNVQALKDMFGADVQEELIEPVE